VALQQTLKWNVVSNVVWLGLVCWVPECDVLFLVH
jgi:hypothetical protein